MILKARALVENELAVALLNAESVVSQGILDYFFPYTTGEMKRLTGSGFDVDDGATLLATFRSLQAESRKQGEAHKVAAQELVTLVADPFGAWASKHAVSRHLLPS